MVSYPITTFSFAVAATLVFAANAADASAYGYFKCKVETGEVLVVVYSEPALFDYQPPDNVPEGDDVEAVFDRSLMQQLKFSGPLRERWVPRFNDKVREIVGRPCSEPEKIHLSGPYETLDEAYWFLDTDAYVEGEVANKEFKVGIVRFP